MSQSLEETPLSKVKRGPNRASYDKDLAIEIIDAALMCHVGQTKDGQVFVTPTCHWREGDYFYWHAHSKARNVDGAFDVTSFRVRATTFIGMLTLKLVTSKAPSTSQKKSALT